MKLKIVITEYCITNSALWYQHYGYYCDGIIINFGLLLDFLQHAQCSTFFVKMSLFFSEENLS